MRSVIVECLLPDKPSRVEEARTMAETIGYQVVEVLVQNRKSEHHSYCIGPGRLEELSRLVEEKNVATAIFTNTLPSSVVFKIQRRLRNGDVKVIDRNLLILEIFDKRAMTREAKLQIQLARLRYTFSWGKEFLKMRGIVGEQVGWSGPGGYPYEEYMMGARRQISRIEKELSELYKKKNLLRARRKEIGYPIVALAGYTQSGKTTLFNRLTKETKSVGLGPFTTLSTFARKVRVQHNGGNADIMFVDSIGFIEEIHPTILKALNTTLSEITNADLIILFVDSTEPLELLDRRVRSMKETLGKLRVNNSLIVCLNKIDAADGSNVEDARESVRRHFEDVPIVEVSGLTGDNVDVLLGEVARIFDAQKSA